MWRDGDAGAQPSVLIRGESKLSVRVRSEPLEEVRHESADAIWEAAVQASILLRHLEKAELKFVRSNSRLLRWKAGDHVYEIDDDAESSYVVQFGTFWESIHGQKLREHTAGCCFGSYALLFSQPRSSSVVAIEAGCTWSIPKRVFDSKLKVAPNKKPALLRFLKSVELFSKLPESHIRELARAAVEKRVSEGDLVCAQGEAARCVFVVRSGAAVATVASDANFKLTMLCTESFGESALQEDDRLRIRMATVSAARDPNQLAEREDGTPYVGYLKRLAPAPATCLLCFEAAHIEALIGFALHEESSRSMNEKLLSSVRVAERSIVRMLAKNPELLAWVTSLLVEETYAEGDVVVHEGSDDEALWMIKRGSAAIVSRGAGEVAQLTTGGFFGELALLTRRSKRHTSIVARGHLQLIKLPMEKIQSNPALKEWRVALEEGVQILQEQEPASAPPMVLASTRGSRKPGKAPKKPLTRRFSFAEMIAEAALQVKRTSLSTPALPVANDGGKPTVHTPTAKRRSVVEQISDTLQHVTHAVRVSRRSKSHF